MVKERIINEFLNAVNLREFFETKRDNASDAEEMLWTYYLLDNYCRIVSDILERVYCNIYVNIYQKADRLSRAEGDVTEEQAKEVIYDAYEYVKSDNLSFCDDITDKNSVHKKAIAAVEKLKLTENSVKGLTNAFNENKNSIIHQYSEQIDFLLNRLYPFGCHYPIDEMNYISTDGRTLDSPYTPDDLPAHIGLDDCLGNFFHILIEIETFINRVFDAKFPLDISSWYGDDNAFLAMDEKGNFNYKLLLRYFAHRIHYLLQFAVLHFNLVKPYSMFDKYVYNID